MSPNPRRRRLAVLGLAATFAVLPLLPATAAPDATVASGDDWEVSVAPGGYEVTVELDAALPIRSDAPTIEVDGVPIGIATESEDGRSLSVFTTDASVAKADDVAPGWFSDPTDGPGVEKSSTARIAEIAEVEAEPLDVNPASTGAYEVTESVYDFGPQSIDLAGIGGIRGELQGKIYLPETEGARPTVLLLHGRHTSCSTGTPNPNRWPCGPNQVNIPSFAGYDGTARALASHGYAVVSVSANAVNSNDNQLALDQGAQARGQLLLDTLTMLDKASKGEPVSYRDEHSGRDVSLADALANQAALPGLPADATTDPMTPADLVGRFDLTDIGMMGHSRGGEGVTSAATLNQALDTPWGIRSILPLAPVDFARMTVPNVAMNVILPYCDGDVSNQQGQHMLDDSRYAFDDDVLRSGVWAMGANHNFYNTVWTPGLYPYAVSDDWGATSTDAVCGPRSSTNIRMTAKEQYDQGTAYMAGWFRLTLGGEKQFLPMFDGSGAVPAVLGDEDVRSVSTAPSSSRRTISTFESTSSLVRTAGAATTSVCASTSGRTVAQALPPCTTTMSTSAVPHWTPASNGGNVPATPVTKMTWTALSTGTTTQTPSEVRVSVPKAARDASGLDRLSVKMAADETVSTGTDLRLSVVDATGKTYSAAVSELNPLALRRLPASGSTTLKKIVLQQVDVATSTLADAGLDVTDLREVRFTAATGADATSTGAVFLSDLALESSSVGTPVVKREPTIDVAAPTVAEGNGPGTADIAVHLDGKASRKVTGYVSVLGSATGRGGITMEKVTFEPGETCKVVTAPILGDTLASSSASTAVKTSVINTSGAVMGKAALGNLVLTEDDGVTGSATMLPPAGVQGDACAELAARGEKGEVTSDDATPAPGAPVTLTATGYRSGEGVTFTLGDVRLGVGVADAVGTVVLATTIPDDFATGATTVTAKGAGTGRTSEGTLKVLTETETTLSMEPETPGINEAATLTAQVTGAGPDGTVEFLDGELSLGTADVVDGVASLEVPQGFSAGTHVLTAVLAETSSTKGSTSNVLTLTLAKDRSSIALVLASDSVVYGQGVKGAVAVANGGGGTVTVSYGRTSLDVALADDGSGSFTLPKTLSAGTYEVKAVFNGTDRVEPSAVATSPLTVTRKGTSTTASSKSSVKRGATLTVRTTVKGSVAGTSPTGTAKVYVKTGSGSFRLAKTVPLKSSAKGVVSTGVKAPSRKTTIRVKVVYSGNGDYAGSTSGVKAVKVK